MHGQSEVKNNSLRPAAARPAEIKAVLLAKSSYCSILDPSVKMLRTYSVMQQNSFSLLCRVFFHVWGVGHPPTKNPGYFSTLSKINDDEYVTWPFLKNRS